MTQLVVSVEDYSLLADIKRAIKMLRGVTEVSVMTTQKNGLDRAIEDVENGRVYSAESVEDMIKQIMQ
ncbi:MAG: response regulator [Bacteroidales bacterium]|nr:response regulator [Bacteroidales bacterium]